MLLHRSAQCWRSIFVLCVLTGLLGSAADAAADVLVIGHRGASVFRPENTIESFQLAFNSGADYIETDLVSTKDHELVLRHENEIGVSTDVAEHPEFADRKTTKTVDGKELSGWFTEDFTLAELKTLFAQESMPQIRPRSARLNGRFRIPTLGELLDYATGLKRGTVLEIKHSSYFRSLGLPIEEGMMEELKQRGLDSENAPVMIESFEVGNLQRLSEQTALPIVQLIDKGGQPFDWSLDERTKSKSYRDMTRAQGLKEIASYAVGISVAKELIVPRDEFNRLAGSTDLVERAHHFGLNIYSWTFRPENIFLPVDFQLPDEGGEWSSFDSARGDFCGELRKFLKEGLDGVFADNPGAAVAVRRTFQR